MPKTYTYDKDKDYKQLMDQAAAAGDYASAAQYEQQRNAKIAGEGLTQYEQTNQYASYLKPTNREKMDEISQKLENQKPFSYAPEADPLYRQYQRQYTRQGKLAMEDTVGKAAALTGGYGNSYAQQVGQQTYNAYVDRANDRIPELYALAQAQYDRERNALLQQYNLYAAMENADLQREQMEWQQEQAAWQQEWQKEQAAWQQAWQKEQAAWNQQQDLWQREQVQWQQEQTEQGVAYELVMSMLSYGIMPSEERLNAAGITAQEAQQYMDMVQANAASSSGGGGKYTGGSAGKLPSDSALWEVYEIFAASGGDHAAIAGQMSLWAGRGYDVYFIYDWLDSVYSSQQEDPVSYGGGGRPLPNFQNRPENYIY